MTHGLIAAVGMRVRYLSRRGVLSSDMTITAEHSATAPERTNAV